MAELAEFFRFPHTPHLAWLGEGQPRDDKVLSALEAERLLAATLVAEEKIDGANLGFSVSPEGELRVQNRGSYLSPDLCHSQLRPLWRWLAPRERALSDALWPDLILFGEWCVAEHSVAYDQLPDWFLGFDVYDRAETRFWDCERRDSLLAELGLHAVPRLGRARFTLSDLQARLGRSRVGSQAMEGLVVRREEDGWTTHRAKLVRASFTQQIDTHWSRRQQRRNALQRGVAPSR